MTFSPHEVACNKSKKGQCEGVAYVNDFFNDSNSERTFAI